jgi:hypothetical protein
MELSTHAVKDQSSQPASSHNPTIILLCELFILRLAGHSTVVDAASGATVLRRTNMYQLIQLSATNTQQQTHSNLLH